LKGCPAMSETRNELTEIYRRLSALEAQSAASNVEILAVKASIDKLTSKIDAQTTIMQQMAMSMASNSAGFRVAIWIGSAMAGLGAFVINHFIPIIK